MTESIPAPAAAGRGAPWPLADSAAFAAVDPTWRAALIARFARDLRRHVIEAWFPRSVDSGGGFWAEHDRAWRRRGDGRRMLEFQARQTRTAARLGMAFPSQREHWSAISLHGLDYLRESLADAAEGGWFWLVDRGGSPLHGATKHAHGISYLVGAAVEVYRLTGRPEALTLVRESVDWLERVHHDDVHGGYHGWVTREGRPILDAADIPTGADPGLREPLGHGVGLKDANVMSDVLEAYALAATVLPDRLLRDRAREVADVICRRMVTPAGSFHYMTYVDGTPVPSLERYGYVLQLPYRLFVANEVLPELGLDPAGISRRLVDHALARAWNPASGAFLAAGPAAEPNSVSGHSLRVMQHEWWAQSEGLRTLTLLSLLGDDPERYRTALDQLVATVDRRFLDHRRGGWHAQPVGEVTLRERLRGAPAKGDQWKDASHEADAYLAALRMLRGLPLDAPLE